MQQQGQGGNAIYYFVKNEHNFSRHFDINPTGPSQIFSPNTYSLNLFFKLAEFTALC